MITYGRRIDEKEVSTAKDSFCFINFRFSKIYDEFM